MKAKIYYFTGSGNSLAVARNLAGKLEAGLISIPSVMSRTSLEPDTEVMGLVFPVYHQGLPVIVKRFIGKLSKLSGVYIFALCTYGDSPALSLKYLQRLLRNKGGELSAGFGVRMPYNYISPTSMKHFYSSFTLHPTPLEAQEKMFSNWRDQMHEACDYITLRKTGRLDTHAEVVESIVDALRLRNALQKPVWLKAAGVAERVDDPFPECIRWMDYGFKVHDACIGCGTCSRLCPVGDIAMKEGRPHWNHRCEQCFACLQWCPKGAIQFGHHAVEAKRYHHPDVVLSDMIQAADKEKSSPL